MMPPSRPCVLMTADAVGGVWVFATTLARALAQAHWRIHLVVLGPQPHREQLDLLPPGEHVEVEITDLALEWLDPAGRDLERALDRLAAIEHRVKPDLVHLNSFREAAGAWSAPVLITAHSCVWSWWRACRGSTPLEPRWLMYRENVRAGLAAATAWVAPTQAMRDEIRSIYAPRTPGTVIGNGIVPLVPGEKQPVILAAGRAWDEAKNIAVLADVAGHLDWPIRLAGPTRSADGETPGFEAGGLEILGTLSRDDLAAHLQSAAIFAAPARYEPFGLAVLEAASAGCALLLSDIPSFRELWNGAACFVDPLDAAAVRAGLERLCRDEALRAALQSAARDRAQHYSLARTARAYARTYEAALSTISPRASRHAGAPAEAMP